MTTKDATNQPLPLYKRLDEQRTQGEFIVDYGHTIGHIKSVKDGRESTPTILRYDCHSKILKKDISEE